MDKPAIMIAILREIAKRQGWTFDVTEFFEKATKQFYNGIEILTFDTTEFNATGQIIVTSMKEMEVEPPVYYAVFYKPKLEKGIKMVGYDPATDSEITFLGFPATAFERYEELFGYPSELSLSLFDLASAVVAYGPDNTALVYEHPVDILMTLDTKELSFIALYVNSALWLLNDLAKPFEPYSPN